MFVDIINMDYKKELQRLQEKLVAIDKLSNCIQKIDNKYQHDNIAYLIHRIIEADYIDTTLARDIVAIQLLANKDIFMSITN